MGSNGCLAVDKTCPIDIDDLYELLHREDGVLVDLFKAESIDEWKRKLGEPTYPTCPLVDASLICAKLFPRGGKCVKCKNAMSGWLSTLLPLRADVSHYHHLYGGSESGLAMCIIWTDAKYWFEVSLLLDNHEMIFAIQIEMKLT